MITIRFLNNKLFLSMDNNKKLVKKLPLPIQLLTPTDKFNIQN